jgi:hypothetical protein
MSPSLIDDSMPAIPLPTTMTSYFIDDSSPDLGAGSAARGWVR